MISWECTLLPLKAHTAKNGEREIFGISPPKYGIVTLENNFFQHFFCPLCRRDFLGEQLTETSMLNGISAHAQTDGADF